MLQLHQATTRQLGKSTLHEKVSRLVAIDPGGTTGVARLYRSHDEHYSEHWYIKTDSFRKWEGMCDWIIPDTLVIVEKPFLTQSTDPVVFESAGAAYLAAYLNGCDVYLQAPNLPQFIWTRYKLTSKDVPGSQHQKDAFCHLAHYLIYQMDWTIEQCLQALARK